MKRLRMLVVQLLVVIVAWEASVVVQGFVVVYDNNSKRKPRCRLYDSSLVDDNNEPSSPNISIPNVEKAWRYIKKPLLRIGSKGVSESHGNSLKQLLESHTAVKVKVNSNTNDYNPIFEQLRAFAVKNGASPQMELIQARFGTGRTTTERILFIGMPGTIEQISRGEYPPPPPPPEKSM